MKEAARRGQPLFLQRLLLFVYALLYGPRFFCSARVVRPSCGICAGSAGVTARRGWSAGTRGALVHGAVLHRAFGRAWSNITLARRAASGLRGLREGLNNKDPEPPAPGNPGDRTHDKVESK